MKRCSRCGVIKALTEFHKSKSQSYGVANRCKECAKEVAREWNANNKERHRERSVRWNKENPEKRKITNAKYSKKNMQHILDYAKKWREALPDPYVARLIRLRCSAEVETIPQELIDVKRIWVMINRELRKEKK